MNTSSSADGISENGVIVGTGVHNGETHASDGARSARPDTHAKSNRYAHSDSDTCAKSSSYTNGAPHSATATVIGSVEAGVSPA